MSDEEKKKTAEEDEETEQPKIDDEASYEPNNEIIAKRKLSLREAFKDIYKGKVNLGSAGSLKFDIDPIGDDKSASVKYTIPLGGRRKR